MNQNSLRAFSFGIIFSTVILASLYYTLPKEKPMLPDTKTLIQNYLAKNDLKAISASELNQLQAAKSKLAALETKQTKPTAKTKTKPIQPKNVATVYTLHIISGMTSEDIAAKLQVAHVIRNAKDFSEFLINNGYHRHIQIGQYKLTSDMSYTDIANIITKNN